MTDDHRSAVDVLRGSRILAYTVGTLLLLAGIVLLAWPDRTITVVARIAGVLIAIVGIGEAIEAITSRKEGSYWGLLLTRGVINLAFGALLLFWGGITVTVLVWLFGIDLVLTAIITLIAATQVPAEAGRTSLIVRSVVALVFGVLVMAWPSVTLTVLAFIVGIQLLLGGLVLLWSGYRLTKVEVVQA